MWLQQTSLVRVPAYRLPFVLCCCVTFHGMHCLMMMLFVTVITFVVVVVAIVLLAPFPKP
jgi:uncharacterized membrane protein